MLATPLSSTPGQPSSAPSQAAASLASILGVTTAPAVPAGACSFAPGLAIAPTSSLMARRKSSASSAHRPVIDLPAFKLEDLPNPIHDDEIREVVIGRSVQEIQGDTGEGGERGIKEELYVKTGQRLPTPYPTRDKWIEDEADEEGEANDSITVEPVEQAAP